MFSLDFKREASSGHWIQVAEAVPKGGRYLVPATSRLSLSLTFPASSVHLPGIILI